VFAGIDTHKDTLAVAVIDDTGRLLAAREVPNTEQGFVQLVVLFDTHQVVRVGIEGLGPLRPRRCRSPPRVLAVSLVGCRGRGAHADDLTGASRPARQGQNRPG
jgi:predicted NBD/HSP70 family sugar kinase